MILLCNKKEGKRKTYFLLIMKLLGGYSHLGLLFHIIGHGMESGIRDEGRKREREKERERDNLD